MLYWRPPVCLLVCQVVAEFCEGPWPRSGIRGDRYYRNVFPRSALPLRANPDLESAAIHRLPLGACFQASDRVINKTGQMWIGTYHEGSNRVLWAIERHAKDGSPILVEVKPPGMRPGVYRNVHPGQQHAKGESSAKLMEGGACFFSQERRLDERCQMWVSVEVDSEGGKTERFRVGESSGGVSFSQWWR